MLFVALAASACTPRLRSIATGCRALVAAWTGAFTLIAATSAVAVAQPLAPPTPGPFSPQQSMAAMKLLPGLRVELAACEPHVIDPVAIRFDEHGRMWVVEMRDYPHGPQPDQPPQSRIKVLEDLDQDGFFETATVFADELLFATGLQPWQGGVIVTRAGQVAYLKDTTGDDRADLHEIWFRGFAQENSQLRANRPRLGLDHHVYVANGLRGGNVVDARRRDAAPVNISNRDFRFDPRSGSYEAVTGVGQFGLTFDDYGNRFVCSNRNPLIHVVIEDRHLQRNPHVAIPRASHDVAAAAEASRIFPISRAWTTSNLHAGQFTAACGVEIYRGTALPAEFVGNAFTCDPTGNLIHREVLSPQGATFTSQPQPQGVEFLASTDEWFRPVNLETGPDGALYVVDMYRAVIEHPEFMPDELKKRPDLILGNDRGRVYRLVADDWKRPAPQKPPAEMTSRELVAQFEHACAWQRETAARLLLERQDAAARPALEHMTQQGKPPLARIHALWALQGMQSLTDEVLLAALGDPHPRVREQAIRLAESRIAAPGVAAALLEATRHGDPRVRFSAALALGASANPNRLRPLAELALRDSADPWLRHAVAAAVPDDSAALLEIVLKELCRPAASRLPEANQAALVDELATLAAAATPAARLKPLAVHVCLLPEDAVAIKRAALSGFARGLPRQQLQLSKLLGDSLDESQQARLLEFRRLLTQTATDPQQPEPERIANVQLLAHFQDAQPALLRLAQEPGPQSVRIAAIAALARTADGATWRMLLSPFAKESPAIRQALLGAALASAQRTVLLLDEIAAGRIQPGEIDQPRTQQLLQHRDPAIRERARELFASAIPVDRQRVLEQYRFCLELTADPVRGKELFRKHCAACHQVGDVGVNVAPDISDSRVKQPLQLLTDILQPNRSIDANYISYSVITTDGQSLVGVIAAETSTSITLRQQENKTTTLLRSQIEHIQSNGVSLMPEGLEKNIPPQDMADLISFVKNWRYLDGKTPLGQ